MTKSIAKRQEIYHKRKHFFLALVLFLIALFLRVYRISYLTDFLGDQGRTLLVIYESFVTKSIPLVGPPVLTGQHLGPFFYYFIGIPLILFNFNPLAVAIFMSCIGAFSVLLVLYLGIKLFDFWTGFFMALLYAVSPVLITQSRQIWEPTPIPFFVLLFIISLFHIYEKRNFSYFLLTGLTLGILIQLHYPNIFLFFPTALVFFTTLFKRRKNESLRQIMGWTVGSIGVFFLMLSPFFLYESRTGFSDVREVIYASLFPVAMVNNTPLFYTLFDFSSRIFRNLYPFGYIWTSIPFAVVIILAPFYKKNFWHTFFVVWFILGIASISLYKGVVFNHYLSFLVPIPFLLLGSFTHTATNVYFRKIVFIFLLVVVFISVSKTDIFFDGQHDLTRVERLTDRMIKLSENKPFSFTLITSNSFSDLHYRYFFAIKKHVPKEIVRTDYNKLFIICEKQPCPTKLEITDVNTVSVLCYDEHCRGQYPIIDLRFWKLHTIEYGYNSAIYAYDRL